MSSVSPPLSSAVRPLAAEPSLGGRMHSILPVVLVMCVMCSLCRSLFTTLRRRPHSERALLTAPGVSLCAQHTCGASGTSRSLCSSFRRCWPPFAKANAYALPLRTTRSHVTLNSLKSTVQQLFIVLELSFTDWQTGDRLPAESAVRHTAEGGTECAPPHLCRRAPARTSLYSPAVFKLLCICPLFDVTCWEYVVRFGARSPSAQCTTSFGTTTSTRPTTTRSCYFSRVRRRCRTFSSSCSTRSHTVSSSSCSS